jgi:dynein regulatory complex protein 1
MANVLDKDTFRVWNAVYVGMEKYHEELVGRYNLSNENLRLSDQNDELKTLLRQYMSARVNDELQIPPSRIMLAQAGMITE